MIRVDSVRDDVGSVRIVLAPHAVILLANMADCNGLIEVPKVPLANLVEVDTSRVIVSEQTVLSEHCFETVVLRSRVTNEL